MKYNTSYNYSNPIFNDIISNEIDNFKSKLSFSIVINCTNNNIKHLHDTLESLEKQWYKEFTVFILLHTEETYEVDFSNYNLKIEKKFITSDIKINETYNTLIKNHTSDYITFLNSNETISNSLLYEILKENQNSYYDFIYTNEDYTKDIQNYRVKYKSYISNALLQSHDYIGKSCFYKTTTLKNFLFHDYTGNSIFYDLNLRLIENAKKYLFLDKVLFHINENILVNIQNNDKLVLEDLIKRRKLSAIVENGLVETSYRIKYNIKDNPLVSIVIPFKDQPHYLVQCINSILELSTYKNFEIIGISNNSTEKKTFEYMDELRNKDTRVKFVEHNVQFNFSEINNYAVKNHANGEHIIFLNNDIKIISKDWIEAMLEFSQQEDIACVGSKLYYENNTIQHCGIKVGTNNIAQHFLGFLKKDESGYLNRASLIQNVTAVTAASLMIKKELFIKIDAFDEDLTVAYNDVDLCIKAVKYGKKNIFTPFSEAYHFESVSRGYDKSNEKRQRLINEQNKLIEKHRDFLKQEDRYITDNIFNEMQFQIHNIKNKSLLKQIRFYSKPIRQKIKNIFKRSK